MCNYLIVNLYVGRTFGVDCSDEESDDKNDGNSSEEDSTFDMDEEVASCTEHLYTTIIYHCRRYTKRMYLKALVTWKGR